MSKKTKKLTIYQQMSKMKKESSEQLWEYIYDKYVSKKSKVKYYE